MSAKKLCGLDVNECGKKDSYKLNSPEGTEKGSDRQEMVMSCLARGPLFKMYCFLGKLKNGNEEDSIPKRCCNNLEKIDYTLKGFIRLNMIQVDSGNPEKGYKRWRRFFGTVKKHPGWDDRKNHYPMIETACKNIGKVVIKNDEKKPFSQQNHINTEKLFDQGWKDVKIFFKEMILNDRNNYKNNHFNPAELRYIADKIREGIWGLLYPAEVKIIEKFRDGLSITDEEKEYLRISISEEKQGQSRVKAIEENWKHFCSDKLGLDKENIPTSWKSRINYKVFKDKNSAKDFISKCPLCQWQEGKNQDNKQIDGQSPKKCPLLNEKNTIKINKENEGIFVLFQLQDYSLLSGNVKENEDGTYPSNFMENDPNSLFSLAKLFRQYLYEKNSCIIPVGSSLDKDKQCTLSNTVNLAGRNDKPLFNKVLLKLTFDGNAKLHSGMDQGIAELTGESFGAKASPQLKMKDKEGNFRDYIQNESFRGLFKSTAEFILENSCFEQENVGQANYATSSYLKAFENLQCPINLSESYYSKIFGYNLTKKIAFAPMICVFPTFPNCLYWAFQNKNKEKEDNRLIDKLFGTTKSRSRIAITYHQQNSISAPIKSNFACEILKLSKGSKELKIDSYKPKSASLQIILDKPTEKELGLILLTIDAISSGHFRVGKMTSRGFGVLRFTNYKMKIYDWDMNELESVEGASGKELLDKILEDKQNGHNQ